MFSNALASKLAQLLRATLPSLSAAPRAAVSACAVKMAEVVMMNSPVTVPSDDDDHSDVPVKNEPTTANTTDTRRSRREPNTNNNDDNADEHQPPEVVDDHNTNGGDDYPWTMWKLLYEEKIGGTPFHSP